MRARRGVAVVAVVVAVGCLLSGCGRGYEDAHEAYRATGEERSAALGSLREETDELAVAELGAPSKGSAAVCVARPADHLGGSHTVSCRARRWVVYREGSADASGQALWNAERAAVRAVVDDLDRAGWHRAGWGPQLDQSLADREYNPYPVSNSTAAKDPVRAQILLVDRRWHRLGGAYEEDFQRFSPLLDDDTGYLVVVAFERPYLSNAPCDDCNDVEPTRWPTP